MIDPPSVPDSSPVAQRKADYWAKAFPSADSRPSPVRTFVDHDAQPWRAILEAILRFVEEDLERRDALSGNR
ncbi:MAG: hypothetical protein P8Y54_04230 [Xanthomonadales bacterium]